MKVKRIDSIRDYVTNDNRFLVIDAAKKTTGNKLLIKDLRTNSKFKTNCW